MNNEIIRFRISLQNALLGRITPDVRGVYVRIIKHCLILIIVIDGEKTNYWNETIYEIGTEVIADFDDNYKINEQLIRLDYPSPLAFKDFVCVYHRYETMPTLA